MYTHIITYSLSLSLSLFVHLYTPYVAQPKLITSIPQKQLLLPLGLTHKNGPGGTREMCPERQR